MRITLDTNILVYAVDADAGPKHDVAVDLIRRASNADCVFTLQSLAEFFFVVTRKGGLGPVQAARFVDAWRADFPIRAASETSLARAMAAVETHGLAFWDALMWATAVDAGCHFLMTEDLQDGRTLQDVRFLNPFNPKNAAALDTALPPRR